jgi:hypothetical protein
MKPLYGKGRTLQAEATCLIDDSFLNFFKVPPLKNYSFIANVDKGFRRAAVIGVQSVKNEIGSMRAVATGFMRSTVVASVRTYPGKKVLIEANIGTSAWYDILVHEGLGRHGSGKIPDKYKPTPFQLAIVEPDAKTRMKYYKPSPKIPRPFLTIGIKKVSSAMNNEVRKGILSGLKIMSYRGRTAPKNNINALLNTAGII